MLSSLMLERLWYFMRLDVIIPTYKPDQNFLKLIQKVNAQTLRPDKIIIYNTEEKYFDPLLRYNRFLMENQNLEIHHISKREFDHGKTRNFAVSKSDADFFICMTQDAMPKNQHVFENLLRPFSDSKVAVTYARQIPYEESSLTEKIVRNYNYPDRNQIKSLDSLPKLGIKTYFCSNVCAAYRRDTFNKLGGFINRTIFNEDMIFAAGAVKQGYKIIYEADAVVFHSHDYTAGEQFHRNFDLGVSQADHPEIFSEVPSEKEGKRMVTQVIHTLWKEKHGNQIFPFIRICIAKFWGYRMGKMYRHLPDGLVLKWSMNQNYWKR